MLHRVIYGSLERFIGILIEHFKGWMPTWLAPVQVRVLNFTDRNEKYAQKIIEELKNKIPDLRVDTDFSQTTLQSKVKDASLLRIPYVITIGDKEEKDKTIVVRVKGNRKLQTFKIEEFIEQICEEIKERK